MELSFHLAHEELALQKDVVSEALQLLPQLLARAWHSCG